MKIIIYDVKRSNKQNKLLYWVNQFGDLLFDRLNNKTISCVLYRPEIQPVNLFYLCVMRCFSITVGYFFVCNPSRVFLWPLQRWMFENYWEDNYAVKAASSGAGKDEVNTNPWGRGFIRNSKIPSYQVSLTKYCTVSSNLLIYKPVSDMTAMKDFRK